MLFRWNWAMRSFALACTLILLGQMVQASVISKAMPGAALRGEASFRFLGFPLYRARLFTPSGAALDWGQDMALELTYQRPLSQYDLVEGTLREFKRLGAPLPLRAQLNRCFRPVAKGDRYTAISKGPNRLDFWRNDTKTCSLKHPNIKQRFMAIFLGKNTRSARFTRRLRGD
jgi:hypothetical protein